MTVVIKLNDFEVLQCTDALHVRVVALRALYQELQNGILSLTDMQEQIDMTKKQVLDLHKKMYNYWQGKNGKWYSYLPKEGVDKPKGKQIESISQEKLDNRIVEHYVNAEKKKRIKKTVVLHFWKYTICGAR